MRPSQGRDGGSIPPTRTDSKKPVTTGFLLSVRVEKANFFAFAGIEPGAAMFSSALKGRKTASQAYEHLVFLSTIKCEQKDLVTWRFDSPYPHFLYVAGLTAT